MTTPTDVRSPAAPSVQTPERAASWPAPIFGLLIALVTALTIGLGVIAPQLGESAPGDLPNGWTVVYDSDLASATGDWKVTADCGFARGGLFANSGESPCVYTPSSRVDYVSQGFRLDATLAPAASVEKNQVAVMLVGTAYFGIAQDGTYALADDAGSSDSEVRGTAFNWHANGLAPNTIRVEWRGADTPLVAYSNGYKVAEISSFSISPSSNHSLEIGASRSGQALYTHLTLASASARG